MTVEELRIEAKKLGYNLIPIDKREKLLPCTCGCKRREHWDFCNDKTGKWETELRCHKCGKTVCGPSEKEAIHNWNEVIKKEMEKEKCSERSCLSGRFAGGDKANKLDKEEKN